MLYIRVQVWAPGERLATVRRSDNLQLEANPPDYLAYLVVKRLLLF